MEVAATLLSVDVVVVETVSPVDTHQANHREEDADTDTCRALHVEGVELLGVGPCVTGFGEAQTVDGGVAQHEWVA